MNKYNLTLVLKPDLEEKARTELLASVTKKMGENVKEEVWGARDLSYPIKKFTKGYYVHYTFETDPKNIISLDKALKIEEDVLRYLIVRI